MREKDASSTGIACRTGIETVIHPRLPIESLPFVGNLVRQGLLSLVVDGTNRDPAVSEACVQSALLNQLVILVIRHGLDLVLIAKFKTAMFDRLERYRRHDGVTLQAYVLMTNHVHLLLETGERPLSRTMQTLQFTYSQYYNRRYDKNGHVFQGRYQAILCDHESYLLELVRYLHLNPARIRSPLSPWTYRWNSHTAYLGRSSPVQVSTAAVLGTWHRQIGPARQAYRQFMQDGLAQGHQDRFYETADQRFLGDERFIEEADRRTAATREVTIRPRRIAFGILLTAVATAHAVTPR